jgi:hypothetical protein
MYSYNHYDKIESTEILVKVAFNTITPSPPPHSSRLNGNTGTYSFHAKTCRLLNPSN